MPLMGYSATLTIPMPHCVQKTGTVSFFFNTGLIVSLTDTKFGVQRGAGPETSCLRFCRRYAYKLATQSIDSIFNRNVELRHFFFLTSKKCNTFRFKRVFICIHILKKKRKKKIQNPHHLFPTAGWREGSHPTTASPE